MASVVEKKLLKIPVLRTLVQVFQRIKLPWLEGLSLYDLMELYIRGIVEGGLTYHASAVAFSFFMALFPFALFILNLIPYIPIDGFQADFLEFVKDGVLPTTAKITILRNTKDSNNDQTVWIKEKKVLIDDMEEINLPVEWLQHVALIDTPGTNAIVAKHELLTQRIVPRADLVLFVTSAERPLSESESSFLSKISQWGKKVSYLLD